MSMAIPWYAVKVQVRQRGTRDVIRTVHIEAKDDDKARQRARKYGKPITAHKISVDNSSIEHIKLKQTPIENVSPAIAMDEMIWQKRNKRRENIFKDKVDISLD